MEFERTETCRQSAKVPQFPIYAEFSFVCFPLSNTRGGHTQTWMLAGPRDTKYGVCRISGNLRGPQAVKFSVTSTGSQYIKNGSFYSKSSPEADN